jgi:uncharacterized protein YgfB (UPF0149 family)
MAQIPSYREIQDAADIGSPSSSAAELHGAMTGMLCVDIHATYEQWAIALLQPQDSPGNGLADAPLRQLFEATQQDLASPDLIFEPLLPDDEEPLTDRARALGGWCQGFLFGLGQSGGRRVWSGDSDELLNDFAEISRLEASDGAERDEEEDYVEIAEFVRVGVQLIRCECETPITSRIH